MPVCFIALGSNLDAPLEQVTRATAELAELPGCTLLCVSPWYRSIAVGPGPQPDYINGVAKLSTSAEPLELLDQLQAIENLHQRQRGQRWGARTLDLDILLYGNQVIDFPTLQIPHPRLQQRNFVLYPLFNLAPTLILPDGSLLKTHRDQCPADGLRLVDRHSSPTIATNSDRAVSSAAILSQKNAGDTP
jgi:2-amino-4-hydroxy-6-hydroxymethyldihydropteridine diphosphokinase